MLVTHIDAGAVGAVTQLYREWFPPGGTLLDLMSSWVSHLPPEVHYRQVIGLGLNHAELDANPRLDGSSMQNLNRTPQLPRFRPKSGTFDAGTPSHRLTG